MKRKLLTVFMAVSMIAVSLAGCAGTAGTTAEQDGSTENIAAAEGQETASAAAEQEQAEIRKTETADAGTPEERAAAFVPQAPQNIQEDENYLYFIYYNTDDMYSLYRQSKADGGREKLSGLESGYIRSFAAADGNLYVFDGENLWFADSRTMKPEKVLEGLTQLQNLSVKDGLLYFEQKDEEGTEYQQNFYVLDEGGRPGERLSAGLTFSSLNDPETEGFWKLETERFGVHIREEKAWYAQRDAEGKLYGEESLICEGYPDILYDDAAALYVGVGKEPQDPSDVLGTYEVLRFDKNSRKTEAVCSIPEAAGLNGAYTNGPASVGILGDQVYYLYLEQEEGKDYLVSTIQKGDAVTKHGEALTIDPAGSLGRLSLAGENMYCPLCGFRDWYWQLELTLEETQPGDRQINEYLQKYYQEKKQYAREFVKNSSIWDETCIHQEAPGLGAISSEASMEVVYAQGRYLNLIQNAYEYGGGAHGMPSRDPLLFDRETGKLLKLADVIGNTEEELKTLVADAFCKPPYCGGYGDWAARWQDVYEAAGPDMLFHLSKEGITFYFTPYEVASYAEGFPEMTVPYDRLNMKITP